MQGMIFDPKREYIKVYMDKNGNKEVVDLHSTGPGYLHEYRLHGVFEQITKRDKWRNWSHHRVNGIEWTGVPEGKYLYSPKKQKPQLIKCGKYDEPPCRSEYRKKLKKILEKTRELVKLGIDRKTAIKAAMQCECHR